MSALAALLLLAAPPDKVEVVVTVSGLELRDVEDFEKWLGEHREVVSAESRSFENGEAVFRVVAGVTSRAFANRLITETFHKRSLVAVQVGNARIVLRLEKPVKK